MKVLKIKFIKVLNLNIFAGSKSSIANLKPTRITLLTAHIV